MSQQQGQNQENSNDYLWASAALIFVIMIVGYAFKKQIIVTIFYVKLFELKIIGLFTTQEDYLVSWIYQHISDADNLNYAKVFQLLNEVGHFIMLPFAIFLGMLAYYVFFHHDSSQYSRVYSLKSLINQESDNWPQIKPITKLNLLDKPIDKGPWRMALSPMSFAKLHNILIKPTTAKMIGVDQVATVDERLAKKVFIKQMGVKLTSIDILPIHIKALFAAFAAIALENRKVGYKLLQDIARSSADGKPQFFNAQNLFDQYKNKSKVQKIIGSHAYVLTLMASMLQFARLDGVLSSADFLWLKPMDRPLWYMLNNVGRQTAFSEVAGPFSHWQTELALERKLNQPMVDPAVTALGAAIQDIVYTEDD